jgi:hypothetical protein
VYLARAAYCYGRNGKRCGDYIADYYINIVPPSYGERLGEYDDESLPGIFRQRRRAVIIVVLAFVCATNGAAATAAAATAAATATDADADAVVTDVDVDVAYTSRRVASRRVEALEARKSRQVR